jgi:translation initiation factor 2B subunit (eIF-2B alpha/beta/delta family)
VTHALIYAHDNKKKFQVYNTETRPLFQGRKTARELKKAGINVTMFVDSALGVALSHEQKTKKVNKIFIGADAILKDGVYNKIGSEVIAQIAKNQKIPVYVVADSWKYSSHEVSSEQRDEDEVWEKAPKNLKIENPAFEFIEKKYIKGIISELGVLGHTEFIAKRQKSDKKYPSGHKNL